MHMKYESSSSNRLEDAKATTIIQERDYYSRSMLKNLWLALFMATILYIGHWLISWLSGLDTADANPRIPAPGIEPVSATTLLAILLAASFAVQSLLRMSRDPRRFTVEEAIAHRQYWGGIANLVALAAAFMFVYALGNGLLGSMRNLELNLYTLFVLPFSALLALLSSTDASVLAENEAKKFSVKNGQYQHEIQHLQTAIAKIPGTSRPRTRRALVFRSIGIGVFSVGTCSLLIYFLLHDWTAVALFASIALLLFCYVVPFVISSASLALQGKLLSSITQLIPAAFVPVVVITQSLVPMLQITGAGGNDRLLASTTILACFATVVPTLMTLVFLMVRRPNSPRASLFLDFQRAKMRRSVIAIRTQTAEKDRRENWEYFAWAAVSLSLIPPAAFFLSVATAWHRRNADRRKRGLYWWAWAAPMVGFLVEIALLVLLPWYGHALGWF